MGGGRSTKGRMRGVREANSLNKKLLIQGTPHMFFAVSGDSSMGQMDNVDESKRSACGGAGFSLSIPLSSTFCLSNLGMGSDWDGIGFGKGLKATQNQSLQAKVFLEYATFHHLLPIQSGDGI